MHGWLDHWAHRHAEELIEEAKRQHLARALREARRNGRPAGWRPAHELARWMVVLAREKFARKAVVEQRACEECFSK